VGEYDTSPVSGHERPHDVYLLRALFVLLKNSVNFVVANFSSRNKLRYYNTTIPQI